MSLRSSLYADDKRHILDRCYKVMQDHLGVDMVAIRMMDANLMEPHEALGICKRDLYKSTAERSEAIHAIIKAVKDKGRHGFTHFVRILEQTGSLYHAHQVIIEELQQDPDYANYVLY